MLVEIWSDIACPWCYLGRGRFQRALEQFEHADEVEVVWRSFELDPSAPATREGGMSELLAAKYGMPVQQARELNQQMTDRAAAEGIAMDFTIARPGNTFDGHRLVHLAASHGLGDAMKGRLFAAYFGEGERIGDHATLRRLALEVGLPADEVDALLAGDRFADEVRADEALAQQLQISGVPFFAVDRQIGASGAQEPAVLLDMLREIKRREQAPAG
jgi:predicted DsbA family dithiol-disulfide isomerase